MLYIICEGEKDKSEYTFVKAVADLYSSGDYSILPASGFANIVYVLYDLEDKLAPKDSVVLFFDNVTFDSEGIYYEMSVPELLSEFSDVCDRHGCKFSHTTYYCFEELYLSYSGLLSIMSRYPEEYSEFLELIQKELLDGKNYFETLLETDKYDRYTAINDFKHIKARYNTREEVSATLLQVFTRRLGHNWKISKNSLGRCWITDCSSEDYMVHLCDKCTFSMKDCTFKDKLDDLHMHSVSSLYEPFSVLFS